MCLSLFDVIYYNKLIKLALSSSSSQNVSLFTDMFIEVGKCCELMIVVLSWTNIFDASERVHFISESIVSYIIRKSSSFGRRPECDFFGCLKHLIELFLFETGLFQLYIRSSIPSNPINNILENE